MERLVINIPDAKSNIVKQILHSLGVAVSGHETPIKGDYKKRLINVSIWTDTDLKQVEYGSQSFNDLKSEEW